MRNLQLSWIQFIVKGWGPQFFSDKCNEDEINQAVARDYYGK